MKRPAKELTEIEKPEVHPDEHNNEEYYDQCTIYCRIFRETTEDFNTL